MSKRINRARIRLAADQLLPDRPVHRSVRGIEMLLPRRHVLPYMATDDSAYAVNLVQLAVELGARQEDELVVLDVGANIGDSALLIRDRVSSRIVCVEGDPRWLTYLGANVGALPDVAIEPVLLSGAGEEQFVSILHESVGTSRVERAPAGEGTPTVPADTLLARRPELAGVRLLKSDTDGYDVQLVPDLAKSFAASRPVIFFEYDPVPTRLVTPDLEPTSVFGGLLDLGYSDAVVWTNGGQLLGACPVGELAERAAELDLPAADRGYSFWDVAVAHKDDVAGAAALDALLERRDFPFDRPWK